MKTKEEILHEATKGNPYESGFVPLSLSWDNCIKAMDVWGKAYAEQAVKLALEKVRKHASLSEPGHGDYFAGRDAERFSTLDLLDEITPASIINEIENTVKE